MNELMVIIGGRQWIYYATDQITADKAFQEFTEKCETSGFNIDNVDIFEVSLRDKNGNEIDFIKFKDEVA